MIALELAIPVVAALALWAMKKWLDVGERSKHRELICQIASGAYYIVEQIARKTPGKIDDKLALSLKMIADELGRALDDDEARAARSHLRSYHERHRASVSLTDRESGKTQIV